MPSRAGHWSAYCGFAEDWTSNRAARSNKTGVPVWKAMQSFSMVDTRMKKRLAIFAACLAAAGALVVAAPQAILQSLGLHPEFEGQRYLLPEGRALIIATSHDRLGEGGAETGVAASELTAPYYELKGGRVDVDIASIRGGKIPFDPVTLSRFIRTHYDKRYLEDPVFKSKVHN